MKGTIFKYFEYIFKSLMLDLKIRIFKLKLTVFAILCYIFIKNISFLQLYKKYETIIQ